MEDWEGGRNKVENIKMGTHTKNFLFLMSFKTFDDWNKNYRTI